MYEDGGGERITLFIRRRPAAEPVTAFRYEVTDEYGVFYWIDDRLAYALTGKLDKAALLGLADRVYDELERRR